MVDQSDGSTIASGTFNIPNGESRVQLDFNVPAGGPYGLRAVGDNPGLWRDGLGSNPSYPFPLGNLGVMTSSTVAGANATAYYYFFYDIEVSSPSMLCEGPRTEVDVNVGPTAIAENGATRGVSMWPNPTSGAVTISLEGLNGPLSLEVMDIAGRIVSRTSLDALREGQATIDVSGLASGEYTLSVQHAQGRSIGRLVRR